MGKNKLEEIFSELSFTDIFETFDDEYLIKIASENPEQLKQMCLFLTLDEQSKLEKYNKILPEDLN